jgi:transposase
MSEKKRTVLTGTQKAKVALKALKGNKTVNAIAHEYGDHPTQVGLWKKALLENAGQLLFYFYINSVIITSSNKPMR